MIKRLVKEDLNYNLNFSFIELMILKTILSDGKVITLWGHNGADRVINSMCDRIRKVIE